MKLNDFIAKGNVVVDILILLVYVAAFTILLSVYAFNADTEVLSWVLGLFGIIMITKLVSVTYTVRGKKVSQYKKEE